MEKYSEIIRASLVDFEEIKFILANNNIDLVSSKEIREKYYLKNSISLKSANYQKIIENSYILANVNNKVYLAYKKESGNDKEVAYLSIENEKEGEEFLNHKGYEEAFTLEMNVYEYGNNDNKIQIINLIGIGLFLSIKCNNLSEDEMMEKLISFELPFSEKNDIVLEKLVINKVRRYLK